MSTLFIFDEAIAINQFSQATSGTIHLFPLTSHLQKITELKRQLEKESIVTVVDSAQWVNEQVNAMQKKIHDWSYHLSISTVFGKKLKDWFLLPDKSGSAWWFGMMSEKNSVQNASFLKIAQINAISAYLNTQSITHVVIALANKNQIKSLKRLCQRHYGTTIIKNSPKKISLKQKLINFTEEGNVRGAIIGALLQWYIWLRQARMARKSLPERNKRINKESSFLFISYFPHIDNEYAKKNIFVNKYAIPLIKKLNEKNIKITWGLMPVFYNGHDYASATNLAKRFSEHGESLFILHEFFTFKVFLKSLYWWIKQAGKSWLAWIVIDKKKLTQDLSSDAALPIVNNLWHHSFLGTSGIRGILFYLTYCEVFKSNKNMQTCLYFCEMQAWEKAMLLAKKKAKP